MIASVVQYQHHAPSGCVLAQQTPQKALEWRIVMQNGHQNIAARDGSMSRKRGVNCSAHGTLDINC